MIAAAFVGERARGGDPDFARDVLPILSDNCFLCHGPDAKSREGDLRLDLHSDELFGARKIITAGQSADSVLIERILSPDPDLVMPPPHTKKSLTPQQVDLLRRWIDSGAAWGQHWAYEPLDQPTIPQVGVREWARGDLDAFILVRLEREGLRPTVESDRARLLRRVTLDLTGLPPTPAETSEFLEDPAPDAYERVVDRLLASPRFGERMVWDWLDAARYADSNGYQGDGERTMWPWRDWAVGALNSNQPFDEFTIWQLAGDLLPDATLEQRVATGFFRNHMINGEGGRIAAENRVDYVMDMTETAATVWLGATFNCCRCHDHKFDPFTQRDYYQLFAFFNSTPVDGGGGNPQTPPVLELPSDEQTRRRHEAGQQLAELQADLARYEQEKFPRDAGQAADLSPAAVERPEEIRKLLAIEPAKRNRNQLDQLAKHWRETLKDNPAEAAYAERVEALRNAIDRRDGVDREIPRVMIMADLPQPRETFRLSKGLYDKPLDQVGIGVPSNLPQLATDAPTNRLGLARWLVADDNPLTARVTVNRFWQQFFGVGLVKTAEDFGVQGERPIHPELLDWLAVEFRQTGWDVKRLCRTIVTSAAYRQSSRVTPELHERDPENRLLARGPRQRLPSWMLRDQALAASGLLVENVGGAPVRPYQPAGVWEEATFGNKRYQQDHGDKLYRRSVYTFWRRIIGPTMFFDTAARQTCSVKQARTNTPLQALVTLNEVTFVEAGRALAERVLREAPTDTDARVRAMFQRILCRPPEPQEAAVLAAAVTRLRRQFAADPTAAAKFLAVGESPRDPEIDPVEHAAWGALAGAIFNLDETLSKE